MCFQWLWSHPWHESCVYVYITASRGSQSYACLWGTLQSTEHLTGDWYKTGESNWKPSTLDAQAPWHSGPYQGTKLPGIPTHQGPGSHQHPSQILTANPRGATGKAHQELATTQFQGISSQVWTVNGTSAPEGRHLPGSLVFSAVWGVATPTLHNIFYHRPQSLWTTVISASRQQSTIKRFLLPRSCMR